MKFVVWIVGSIVLLSVHYAQSVVPVGLNIVSSYTGTLSLVTSGLTLYQDQRWTDTDTANLELTSSQVGVDYHIFEESNQLPTESGVLGSTESNDTFSISHMLTSGSLQWHADLDWMSEIVTTIPTQPLFIDRIAPTPITMTDTIVFSPGNTTINIGLKRSGSVDGQTQIDYYIVQIYDGGATPSQTILTSNTDITVPYDRFEQPEIRWSVVAVDMLGNQSLVVTTTAINTINLTSVSGGSNPVLPNRDDNNDTNNENNDTNNTDDVIDGNNIEDVNIIDGLIDYPNLIASPSDYTDTNNNVYFIDNNSDLGTSTHTDTTINGVNDLVLADAIENNNNITNQANDTNEDIIYDVQNNMDAINPGNMEQNNDIAIIDLRYVDGEQSIVLTPDGDVIHGAAPIREGKSARVLGYASEGNYSGICIVMIVFMMCQILLVAHYWIVLCVRIKNHDAKFDRSDH